MRGSRGGGSLRRRRAISAAWASASSRTYGLLESMYGAWPRLPRWKSITVAEPRSMAQSQDNSARVLLACSLWLHAGFIGAVAAAAGVILLFDSKASLLSALALVFPGGFLAAACWQRARTV